MNQAISLENEIEYERSIKVRMFVLHFHKFFTYFIIKTTACKHFFFHYHLSKLFTGISANKEAGNYVGFSFAKRKHCKCVRM